LVLFFKKTLSFLMACSFPPVAAPGARVLILGSLPGQMSLARQEYYAHPANAFWWIMGALVGAGPGLPYGERLDVLRRRGIALWDVCGAAERPGSLDTDIVFDSIAPNDIAGLLLEHAGIGLICFNGAKSAAIFRRLVAPSLPAAVAAIPRHVLLSTSPACTRPRAEKLAVWRGRLGQVLA
jgi:hypoxanthine-DNA glycosylase